MDWLVAALGVVSAYLLGEKKRVGWLVKAAGGASAIWVNLSYGLYGFVAMSVVAGVVCVYNYWKWGSEKPCTLCSK